MSACVLAACTSTGLTPAASATAASPAAWPMYRGDLARDGHPAGATLDAGGASRLEPVWRAELDGPIDGTPAIVAGVVIAGTAAGTLAAVDSSTGRTLWARGGLGPISGSAAVDSGMVYVGTLSGHVRALELMTGRAVWDWLGPADAAIWSSPVAYRGLVIVGVASPYGDSPLVAGRLYGLDSTTGHVRWSVCIESGCAPGGGVWSTAAIDSTGTAFVGIGNPDDGVLAFDPMTGARKWLSYLYPDQNRDLDVGASPVVFTLEGREVIAQASVEGLLALLDARTNGVIWSRELVAGSAVHGLIATPAYDGSAIYAASASPPNGVTRVAATDGLTVWRQTTALPVYSAPAAGNGVIVFGTGSVFGDLNAGSIVALAAVDGHLLWTYDTRSAVRSGPAIAGNLVVVGDQAGDLLAFRPSA